MRPMEAFVEDNRRYARYQVAQKAVLFGEADVDHLCLVTNFSRGGLCLAVVGTDKPRNREFINVRFNRRLFLCNIVNRGKTGLHCRFASPVVESVFRQLMSFNPIDLRDDMETIRRIRNVPVFPQNVDDENHGVFDHEGRGYHLSYIYADGFFAGGEQIDPNIDALEATVDVLNPYGTPEERERWALGFKDAIGRLAMRGRP